MAADESHRRRRGGAAAAFVVPALASLLIGCGRDSVPPDPTGPPTVPPVTHAPGVGVADEEATFPATAQEYAERTVAAWAAPDLFRLAELASPSVHSEIVDLPGPPNRAWRSVLCEPATSSTDCTFHNLDGDALVLTIEHDLLGEARATTAMGFDPTTYPSEPRDYVAALVAAWQSGNLARMRRLAEPDAVATLQALPAPDEDEVSYRPGAPGTVVVVLPETQVVATVDPALLGQARAVQAAATLPE